METTTDKSKQMTPTAIDELSEISAAEVDENLSMALRALSLKLRQPTDQVDQAEEPFAAELASWIKIGLVTKEGVKLTREEFRRRLESERARYAGRAEKSLIGEACDRLERRVFALTDDR